MGLGSLNLGLTKMGLTKINLGPKKCPHLHYDRGVILYVLKAPNIFLRLILTMRPKVQFTTQDLEFEEFEGKNSRGIQTLFLFL